MSTHRQRFLHDLPTLVALLRGETRVHSDHLMSSTCSLYFKDIEECAPRSVHDTLCQGMILHHIENSKLLNGNDPVLFSVLLCSLIVKITALTGNLEMRLSRALCGLTASMAAFLAAAQLALF